MNLRCSGYTICSTMYMFYVVEVTVMCALFGASCVYLAYQFLKRK